MNALTHDIITITNDGPLIERTNYWRTQSCRTGHAFISWNADTARLLLPVTLERCLSDMAMAKYVIISQGPAYVSGRDRVEILFEDLSGEPFALVIGSDQTGRMPTESMLENFALTVWTKDGLQQRHSATFRRAN